MCSNPVLSVRDLRIQIGRQPVVEGLSFDVMADERVCLWVPRGQENRLPPKRC